MTREQLMAVIDVQARWLNAIDLNRRREALNTVMEAVDAYRDTPVTPKPRRPRTAASARSRAT